MWTTNHDRKYILYATPVLIETKCHEAEFQQTNHESDVYKRQMGKGLQWNWMFKKNVGYYQNQVVKIDDTDFIMSTLWSQISPSDEYFLWKGMNDFRQIMYNGKLLQTEEFNQMHEFLSLIHI